MSDILGILSAIVVSALVLAAIAIAFCGVVVAAAKLADLLCWLEFRNTVGFERVLPKNAYGAAVGNPYWRKIKRGESFDFENKVWRDLNGCEHWPDPMKGYVIVNGERVTAPKLPKGWAAKKEDANV